MEFGGEYGKLALSIFRLLAVVGLTYGLWQLIRKKAPMGFVIALSLIIAGALGNIIDSAFYGLIFSESTYTDVATVFPAEGGYAGFLHGYVVDMLYFPLFEGTFPEGFPFWGGEPFVFFRPVFNIADSSISVGVALIILRQKSYFSSPALKPTPKNHEEAEPTELGNEVSDSTDSQEKSPSSDNSGEQAENGGLSHSQQ